jgi:hypothetical protein
LARISISEGAGFTPSCLPELPAFELQWDFDTMAEWGVDFVRLPTDHRIWTASTGVYRAQPLREIDQAIVSTRRY